MIMKNMVTPSVLKSLTFNSGGCEYKRHNYLCVKEKLSVHLCSIFPIQHHFASFCSKTFIKENYLF